MFDSILLDLAHLGCVLWYGILDLDQPWFMWLEGWFLGPLLLRWIDFNLNMVKKSHAQ